MGEPAIRAKGILAMKTTTVILILCSMALCMTSSTFARSSDAEAIVVKGDVVATPPQKANAQQVQNGSTVEVGSTIKTGTSSDVLLSAFPGSAIRVLERNEVILKESDLEQRGETILGRKAVLDLRRGSVQVALEKRDGGPVEFTVTTPQCVAAARGTVFETSTEGGATKTVVLDGTVVLPTGNANAASDGKQVADGKEVVLAVGPGQKGIIRKTPEGVVQEGPYPATEAELKSLKEFVELAAAEGLILPPVGELMPPNNFNVLPPVFPPVVTDTPLSN